MKILRGLGELPHGCSQPVASIGNFDGVHVGHRKLMGDLVARSRAIGGTPTIVTFDPHPLDVLAPDNAPRRIQTFTQKAGIIESLGIELLLVIPFTREFARTGARDFVRHFLHEKFNLSEIYVGQNFAFGHRREGSFNLLKEMGQELGFHVGTIQLRSFRGARVSSTAVRQALVQGQVALARRLLGRPFSLEGEVVRGAATGALIRFPTANIRTGNDLVPRRGVYVTLLSVDRCPLRSVTNIGVRPTLTAASGEPPLTIESHVLDFSENIYGRRVRLEFLVHLREERRFGSVGALAAQIAADVGRARRYFRWAEAAWRRPLPEGAGAVTT